MTPDPIRAIADAVLYEGYILWPYRRSALKNQRRFTFGGVYPPAHSRDHPDDPATMRTEVLLTASAQARLEVTVRFLHVVRRAVARRGPEGLEEVDAAPAEGVGAWRLSVQIENRTPFRAGSREEALAHTFCSTHTMLHAPQAQFVSLADPPVKFKTAAAACRNVGTWPVLVGDPGERTTVLSSPIILEDYPRVAPESPGDLFDGGEIDQLLILNILALTDEEKAEMAASDPRAREILKRTEGLTPEQLMALHGTVREFGMAR